MTTNTTTEIKATDYRVRFVDGGRVEWTASHAAGSFEPIAPMAVADAAAIVASLHDLFPQLAITRRAAWAAGKMDIHVYYLGCGHVAWLNVPGDVPETFRCLTCHGDRVVMAWSSDTVLEGPAMACPPSQVKLADDVAELLYPFDGEPGYEWVRGVLSRLPRRPDTGRVATCRDCRGPLVDDPWGVSPDGHGLTCPTCKQDVAPF